MTKTELGEGIIRLTSEYGILDKRNNKVYSEYVGDEKKEHFFADAPAPEGAKKSTRKKK